MIGDMHEPIISVNLVAVIFLLPDNARVCSKIKLGDYISPDSAALKRGDEQAYATDPSWRSQI